MSQPNSVSEAACENENGKTTITLNITVGSGCEGVGGTPGAGSPSPKASPTQKVAPIADGSGAAQAASSTSAASAHDGGAQGGSQQSSGKQDPSSYVEPAQVQGSVAMREPSAERSAKDPNMAARIVALAQQRVSMGGIAVKDLGVDHVFHKIDEVAEAEDIQKGIEPAPSLYCQTTSRASRYSKMYNDNGESPLERSFKITPAAREDVNKMHKILESFFDMLLTALESLPKKDFSVCEDMLGLICQVQSTLVDLIEHLRYGPYKNELEEINERLIAMIDELEIGPPFVLLRLVEFGFNIYELGNRLREELLPSSFAHLVHKVQSRIYRLQTGRIVRQIYFVPFDMDPVLGTYFKSRRLIKLEHFCHCSIVLLPPDDPRSSYCPYNHRTIEVNFDIKKGRYLGFQHLLNQTATDKCHTARLAASIFRRLSGAEIELSPEDMFEMETTEARIAYTTLKANMVAGTGLAVAPKIDT